MLSQSVSTSHTAPAKGNGAIMPASKSNNDFLATNDDVNSTTKSSVGGGNSVMNYMKDLDRVQEQQAVYASKIEKERRRQATLNKNIKTAKDELLHMKARTKNGKIAKEEKTVHQKFIHKLEHQVQMAKIKLSGARGDNQALKKKIDQLRRDKMLYNQIQRDFKAEVTVVDKKNEEGKKEIQAITERKHRVKMEIATIKNKMMSDIEEFASEMERAKSSISATQANILNSIRERLSTTIGTNPTSPSPAVRTIKTTDDAPRENAFASSQMEIADKLAELGFESLQELISGLQASEEQVFSLYRDIQRKNSEVEAFDLSNKELEGDLAVQTRKLSDLQSHNDQIKSDLERSISAIQKSIAEYEKDYNSHVDVISSVSDDVMTLLGNIAIDEDALDQQLLASGITDRNVDAFLGLIEQRIDDLIQMGKAASREALVHDDFVQRDPRGGQIFQPPAVPSLNDIGQNGDEEDEVDENQRIQPTNIAVLKEYMKKRIQKHIKKTTLTASMTSQQQEIIMQAQAVVRATSTPPGSPGNSMIAERRKSSTPTNKPELVAIQE